MSPIHRFVNCCGRELHLTCWGDPSSPLIVMWHGLTRTGRDFDELASRLAKRYYLVCPDTLGRGLSQWSPDPAKEYQIDFYVEQARELLKQLERQTCIWIGTSMGGLVGIRLAAQHPSLIQALLVNDIGPDLPLDALQRIHDYVAIQPVMDSVSALEQWLRSVYRPFGPHEDLFWRRMAITSSRRLPDGRITLHYDPAIVQGFQLPADPMTLPHYWDDWAAIECPILLVQGAESDLLSSALVEQMLQKQPRMHWFSVPGIGHAPTLVDADQQRQVIHWLSTL